MSKKVEILSPVGSYKHLEVAIKNGADAVYFGVGEHNARQGAANFTKDEVYKAVSLCHSHGVKVYGALNTSVTDREIGSALEIARLFYEAGADALILQDEGLASLTKQAFPEISLHASTQMSVFNVEGVLRLAEKGFDRVVLARELSRENIFYIAKHSPIEIEVFVHGALCMSVSGQCYMSAIIGQRSGNRGRCAQPCRLPYYVDNKECFPLSLKDLFLGDYVSELEKNGVASLKIEGRMKRPEYVALATATYKNALQGKGITEKSRNDLANIFSRQGFTAGYYKNELGKGMLGVRSQKDIENSKINVQKEEHLFVNEAFLEPPKREIREIHIDVKPCGKKGKPKMEVRFLKVQQVPERIKDFSSERIWLPLEEILKEKSTVHTWLKNGLTIGAELPRIVLDDGFEYLKLKLKEVFDLGVSLALCGNYSFVKTVKEIGFTAVGDYGLNIFNSFSLRQAKSNGFDEVTLSFELSFPQIRDMQKEIPCTILAYGHLPLMIFRNCVMKSFSSCKDCKGQLKVKDRVGEKFTILKEYDCFNSLLNSKPLYLADKEDYKKIGVHFYRLYFTTETKERCEEIIKAYHENLKPKGDFTRGLYYKGVI